MHVKDLLARNQEYLKQFAYAEHTARPTKKLAIVACMDCRSTVGDVFQLKQGDAIVIRTAGGTVDDGVLRSLIVATNALGVEHVVVMGHNDCGMLGVGADPEGFAEKIGAPAELGAWLSGFTDAEQNVRDGMEKIRNHPHIAKCTVDGFMYRNETGVVEHIE
ncbi:MAG: beta-class carbonic anhydrase [Thermoplasmatota archaeon]